MGETGAIELNHVFELFVPTQCVCKEPLDPTFRNKVLLNVQTNFARWFGGYNVSKVEGGWILPDDSLASEVVEVVRSYATDEAHEDFEDNVKKLAVSVADQLTQDMVLITIDGRRILFPRSTPDATTCSHGLSGRLSRSNKPVLKPLQKLQTLYSTLANFERLIDAKNLFCGMLNYRFADSLFPQAGWPENIKKLVKEPPRIIADTNGFQIVYLRLVAEELRRGPERQIIQRIYQENISFRGLFIVSDASQSNWELVNIKTTHEKKGNLILRRMRVGTAAVRTATERLLKLYVDDETISAADLQVKHDEAFNVSTLTRDFFHEISNWYFWAKEHVHFPPGQDKNPLDVIQATATIRLITRLIFVWFLKEKRADGRSLVPEELFEPRTILEIVKGFDPEGKAEKPSSAYYQAILQNLFFATLNQPMEKRCWFDVKSGDDNNVYRYRKLFTRHEDALSLFKKIPFLNGGLFECLEQDQFSDRTDSSLEVPDYLFFGPKRNVDLNAIYGTRNKRYAIGGIIPILKRYNFTFEENTPLEEEIALDPELLGKVFENLLASFNPETGITARKKTGSFYTPREIVNYMVDSSLKAYLAQKLEEIGSEEVLVRLDRLLAYDDTENPFSPKETEHLINALHEIKVLDPACGSGAFPMGILHKMTHILAKLDPVNALWKERQLRNITDTALREHVERTFDFNDKGYGRKLYLIQNCIFGVDIQPIAVQIAKLRFFISLMVDQRIDHTQDNLGILPLPNMETRFVAANTLIGVQTGQLSIQDPAVTTKEKELRTLRGRYFSATSREVKQQCIKKDERLRRDLGELLKRSAWKPSTADKVVKWDPYDTTTSSDFFDPEWMFGITEGFDLCIGNPPYVRHEEIKDQKIQLKETFGSFYSGTADLYTYFYKKGLDLLKRGGRLCYIAPDKFMRVGYGKNTRKILTSAAIPKIVLNCAVLPIFDATTYPAIVLVEKSASNGLAGRSGNDQVFTATFTDPGQVDDFQSIVKEIGFFMPVADLSEDVWILERREVLALMSKLRQVGTPLGTYVNGKLYYGIKTGLNDAFVIDRSTRDRLIAEDPRCEKVIKPWLRGRDIRKWRADWPGLYIIAIASSANQDWPWSKSKNEVQALAIFKETYPAIFKYVIPFAKALKKRDDKGKFFWELRSCAYYQEFAKEKIVWRHFATVPEFILDVSGFFSNDKSYILPKKELALLGILNSSITDFFIRQISPKVRGGYLEMRIIFMEQFPVCKATAEQKNKLEKIVKIILAQKDGTDITTYEMEIDRLVYHLYGLTEEEIVLVEAQR